MHHSALLSGLLSRSCEQYAVLNLSLSALVVPCRGRQPGPGMRRERPRLLDGFAATSLVLAPIVAVVGRSRRIPAEWQWKETQ